MQHVEPQTPNPQTASITPMDPRTERILDIFLDASVNAFRTPQVEHECATAVADLLQENYFHLCKNPGGAPVARGPYNLYLSIQDNRMVMDIHRLALEDGRYVEYIKERVAVPVSPFRRVVKDYFLVVESYYNAITGARPSQMETLDMARRGIHNEGAELLQQVIDPSINMDFDTARRLFTLLCVLHIR
jgi:uncharacterized protein (UPF0262 family)